MNYEELEKLNKRILNCPFISMDNTPCGRIAEFRPVINELKPTQKYLIISSDPSRDTDKTKNILEPHSNFERRFLALLFSGSDDPETCQKLKDWHPQLKNVFLKYFYWAHFCKCFSNGNPNSHCAKKYLEKEIGLFEPKLIIAIGGKSTQFLLGSHKLKDTVNKILDYKGTPAICTLHPSQNWNRQKRGEYAFYETWKLIRRKAKFSAEDETKIQNILEAALGRQENQKVSTLQLWG